MNLGGGAGKASKRRLDSEGFDFSMLTPGRSSSSPRHRLSDMLSVPEFRGATGPVSTRGPNSRIQNVGHVTCSRKRKRTERCHRGTYPVFYRSMVFVFVRRGKSLPQKFLIHIS